jgi:hypothetical protein
MIGLHYWERTWMIEGEFLERYIFLRSSTSRIPRLCLRVGYSQAAVSIPNFSLIGNTNFEIDCKNWLGLAMLIFCGAKRA